MGNPATIALGPGHLLIAPLGTPEPTNLATAWDEDWTDLGYTAEGSEFVYEVTSAPVEVAEELDPVRIVMTGRNARVNFALAEITAANLKRALNGGTITTGTGIVTFDPPAPGAEVRTMLGWESDAEDERWIFRQCLQSGSLSLVRRKGAEKSTLPVSFALEKPAGLQPFRAILDDARA